MRVAERVGLMIAVAGVLVLGQAQAPDTQAPSPAAPVATPQAPAIKPATPPVTAPPAPVMGPPATPSAAPPTPPNPTGAHALTTPDLEAFFDGILPLQLERSDVAGASVLVMKDGNVLFEKG